MRRCLLFLCCLAFAGASLSGFDHAAAQAGAAPARVVWEVKNRFRLFREAKDFQLHVDALNGHSVLESEDILARESEGRGWARNMLARLCIDAAGRIADPCMRDGEAENYLAPTEHAVGVRLVGGAGTACAWHFDDGDGPRDVAGDCAAEVKLRVRYGKPTRAGVDVTHADGTVEHASTDIVVRDLLIAGLGDSVGSGEGNPDRPVALSDEGFCFRQFVAMAHSDYFRPGRAGFKGDKSCEPGRGADFSDEWNRLSARWQNAACHRSLYSYQVRASLALAVENSHIAVTFLPLACTGATIDAGLLSGQRAREANCGEAVCPATMTGQVAQLQALLRAAARPLDLVLLTVGANDIDFSGLVADVIIQEGWARALFGRGGVLGSVDNSQDRLDRRLPRDFARLRAALRPLATGDLSRVVFVSYGQPALDADGAPCPGGRDGFDIHPAFGVDADRLNRAAAFVQGRFLPRIKALATCTEGVVCGTDGDAMTFVDAHQRAFQGHGVCARADTDPPFDRDCFSPTGDSFTPSLVEGATAPLVCDRQPSEFRAYAPRARWFRTANDSYFAAMTYPRGLALTMQPSDIHDATWGLLSAVYGGAIHPTAEGHAAMADAALVEARRVLMLAPPSADVTAEPLPPPAPADTAPGRTP